MPVRGKHAGNRGQGSKWISRKRRRAIYDRDAWRCVWCGVEVHLPDGYERHATEATLDHLRHRSEGGDNQTRNLITACHGCNRLRGKQPASDFALVVARLRQVPVRGVMRGVLRAIGRQLAA